MATISEKYRYLDETLNGGAGDDRFILNKIGYGFNSIFTGGGHDTVTGLGLSPTGVGNYDSDSIFLRDSVTTPDEFRFASMVDLYGSRASNLAEFYLRPVVLLGVGDGDSLVFETSGGNISKIYEMGPTAVTVAPHSIGFLKPAGYEISILFVDISGDGDPEFSVAFSDYWENGASVTVDDFILSYEPGGITRVTIKDGGAAPPPKVVPEDQTEAIISGDEDDERIVVHQSGRGYQIIGRGGADTVTGSDHDDLIYGNQDTDSLAGGAGLDTLYGGQQEDNLRGGVDDDIVFGNKQNDIVYGDDGNDTVYGGQQDDTVYGGAGDDHVHGNGGNDLLMGGVGADTYFFARDSDTVRGFDPAEGDRLALKDKVTGVSANDGNLLLRHATGSVELAGLAPATWDDAARANWLI